MLVYNEQYELYYVWINSHLKILNCGVMIIFEFQTDSSNGIIEKKMYQLKSPSLVKYFSNLFSPCIHNCFFSFTPNHFSSKLVLAGKTRTRLHIGEIFNEQNNRPY